MTHLGISGGGFAISGLAGASLELLINGIKPNIVSGVSSGAILTFIICCSKNPIKVISEQSIGYKLSDVFSKPPFNPKTNNLTYSACWNMIFKNYLGNPDKLPNLLKSFVSEKEFEHYKESKDTPIGIVMSVDLITASRKFANLKDYSYEDAIRLVVASASVPVFTKPISFDNCILVDGGIRDHILTPWVFQTIEGITESYSIYSRTKDMERKQVKSSDFFNIPKMLRGSLEIMSNEISKSDEIKSNLLAELKGIEHYNIFVKNTLDSIFEEDISKQREMYNNAREEVLRQLLKIKYKNN